MTGLLQSKKAKQNYQTSKENHIQEQKVRYNILHLYTKKQVG